MRGRLLFAVALLALAVRLVYLYQLEGDPLLGVLMGDARVYDQWAQQIASGHWLGTEVFYQTPLYPYALGLVYTLTGHDVAIVRIIQAVLGAAACGLIGLAGRRFFDDRVALVAAAMLAIYPSAIFFDGLIQKSSLDLFLMTLVLALVGEFEVRRRRSWLIALGVASGALALNRENAFVLLPVIGAWIWFRFREVSPARRAGWLAAFVAAVLAVLLPVGIRNYRVSGEFVLSTSQLGPNFYIGNNPRASGSYESLVPGRGDPIYERADATTLASQAAGRPLSPTEVSHYWLGRSFAYIRSQPLDWMVLSGRKLLLAINAAEIPDTESIEAYAESSGLLRALLWLNFGVLLPLAAVGIWAWRREWRRLVVLYGMGASLLLAVVAFFVVARYRHPLVPIVLLFSAAGAGSLVRIRTTGRGWIAGIAAAAVLAIVTHIPMKVVHDQTYINLGGFLVRSSRPQEAIPLLRKAVATDPGDPSAHAQLGLALRDTGQTQAALDELSRAVRLNPGYPEAQGALGLLFIDLARPQEAIAPLREAARLQPDSADTHSNLALALTAAGPANYEEAFRHFDEAVRLKPDGFNVRMNFGGALCQAERVDDCVAQYREAERIDPRSVDAPYFAARAYAQDGRLPEALASLEKALRVANATGLVERAKALAEIIANTKVAMGRR